MEKAFDNILFFYNINMENNIGERQNGLNVENNCWVCKTVMTSEEDFGTEEDGTINMNYCIRCYHDGVLVEEGGGKDEA